MAVAALYILTNLINNMKILSRRSTIAKTRLQELLEEVGPLGLNLAEQLMGGECSESLLAKIIGALRKYPLAIRTIENGVSALRGGIDLQETGDIVAEFLEVYNEARRTLTSLDSSSTENNS